MADVPASSSGTARKGRVAQTARVYSSRREKAPCHVIQRPEDMNIKDFVSAIFSELEPLGFKRRGMKLYRITNEGYQLIDIQRSRDSSPTAILFTINLGTYLWRLGKFFPAKSDPISVEECHWWRRLGFVLPGNEDAWWKIDAETDTQELREALVEALKLYGIPALELYSREEGLRALWLQDLPPNLADFQRLMYLAALISETGPPDQLAPIVKRLHEVTDGEPTAVLARHLLRKLPIDEKALQSHEPV